MLVLLAPCLELLLQVSSCFFQGSLRVLENERAVFVCCWRPLSYERKPWPCRFFHSSSVCTLRFSCCRQSSQELRSLGSNAVILPCSGRHVPGPRRPRCVGESWGFASSARGVVGTPTTLPCGCVPASVFVWGVGMNRPIHPSTRAPIVRFSHQIVASPSVSLCVALSMSVSICMYTSSCTVHTSLQAPVTDHQRIRGGSRLPQNRRVETLASLRKTAAAAADGNGEIGAKV